MKVFFMYEYLDLFLDADLFLDVRDAVYNTVENFYEWVKQAPSWHLCRIFNWQIKLRFPTSTSPISRFF